MSNNSDRPNVSEEELFPSEITAIAENIYRAYLPPYLEDSWQNGRGKWYGDLIREQLDSLVISETYDDPERLAELKSLESTVSLVLGIFGAAFRILDHIGMHLRGQTMGQYELLPEDEALLRQLCQHFLETEPLELDPFHQLSG